MAELLALTGRHLRTSARSRATRVTLVLFVLALGLAALMGRDVSSASLPLVVALLVLVLVVTGFSMGAGAVLPEDRVSGREAWLATLAPPGWKRRLSVVLAGWLLAAGTGWVGGAVVGVAAVCSRDDLALRAWSPLPVPGARLLGGRDPVIVLLPPGAIDQRELELDVRPLLRGEGRIDRLEVLWTTAKENGRFVASVRGPLRFSPPEGAEAVHLTTLTPGVRLRVVAARWLGPVRAPVPTLAWIGLLLGLLAGAVAPVAVLLSRATTGQTAAAGAFCLLLLGSVKEGLSGLAARLEPEGVKALVPGLLEVFALLTPDAPLLDLLVEATAQRAPPLGALGLVLPALGYTALVAVLACVPVPARWASEANA